MNYTMHPAADIFPMMDEPDFQRLKEDIRQNGLQESITLWRNQLIDGRNRLRACEELGIQHDPNEIDDDADPIAYVLSANMHRRHLSKTQVAMVGAKVFELYTSQAKERQKLSKGRGKKGVANLPQVIPESNGKARDHAGKAVNVSGKMIDHATKVLDSGNKALIKACEADVVPVSLASSVIKSDVPAKDIAEALKSDNPAKALRSTIKTERKKKPIKCPECGHEWVK